MDISTITASNVKELIGRYCGDRIDSPLLSMHPRAEIIFRSNHIIHHQGFHGTYEFRHESKLYKFLEFISFYKIWNPNEIGTQDVSDKQHYSSPLLNLRWNFQFFPIYNGIPANCDKYSCIKDTGADSTLGNII